MCFLFTFFPSLEKTLLCKHTVEFFRLENCGLDLVKTVEEWGK